MEKEGLAESAPEREAFVYIASRKPEPRPKKQRHEARHERTAQKLISQMIDKYVGIEERRAQFLRDAAKAWDEYRRHGLRATSREVIAWLEAWSDEDESEGPACHR